MSTKLGLDGPTHHNLIHHIDHRQLITHLFFLTVVFSASSTCFHWMLLILSTCEGSKMGFRNRNESEQSIIHHHHAASSQQCSIIPNSLTISPSASNRPLSCCLNKVTAASPDSIYVQQCFELLALPDSSLHHQELFSHCMSGE